MNLLPIIEYNNNMTDADKYLNHYVPIQMAVDQSLIIKRKTKSPIQLSNNFGALNFFYNTALLVLTMTLSKYILFEKETGIKKTRNLIEFIAKFANSIYKVVSNEILGLLRNSELVSIESGPNKDDNPIISINSQLA
ncbi:hypothetical protein H8356DRAFT_1350233 [Neocallimastix lanati (nom. inval.)]|nr:hypothetical protein H8356DRAFT_1350233 [Neocallimastix sp. JGI-2020a]